VNGARQSHRLTAALQDRLTAAARDGRLQRMPPILTFQSVVDFTVSTRAIISSLYALLPANGSELVLFDLNRASKISSGLLRNASETILTRILPDPPRNYRTTIIANVADDREDVAERVTEPAAVSERTRELGLAFPPGLFSLSHVALPFPMNDALYGLEPDGQENFGVNLGAIAPRGERGVLIVDLDALVRVSSNPFFPYILERLDEGMALPVRAKP
jgi:alpha-beta hydrolase superfamily lysophospholipase